MRHRGRARAQSQAQLGVVELTVDADGLGRWREERRSTGVDVVAGGVVAQVPARYADGELLDGVAVEVTERDGAAEAGLEPAPSGHLCVRSTTHGPRRPEHVDTPAVPERARRAHHQVEVTTVEIAVAIAAPVPSLLSAPAKLHRRHQSGKQMAGLTIDERYLPRPGPRSPSAAARWR